MVDAQRFPYKIIDISLGMVDRMPYLPLTLGSNGHSLNVEGLNALLNSLNSFCNALELSYEYKPFNNYNPG